MRTLWACVRQWPRLSGRDSVVMPFNPWSQTKPFAPRGRLQPRTVCPTGLVLTPDRLHQRNVH